MRHEIISVVDQTPEGNGRDIIWRALGLLIQDRCERIKVEHRLHQTEASLRHQAAYRHDIESAAAMMRAVRPESAGEVSGFLGAYPWREAPKPPDAREPAAAVPRQEALAASPPPDGRSEKRAVGPKQQKAARRPGRGLRL